MEKNKIGLGLIALTTLVSGVSMAATTKTTVTKTTTTGTTSTAVAPAAPAEMDPAFAAYYWGQFSGPAVGNLTQYQALDRGGDDLESPSNLDAQLTMGYRFGEGNSKIIGGIGEFVYQPFAGQDVRMKDPAFKIGDHKFISWNGINDYADLRMYAPTSNSYKKTQNEITAFQTLHIISYDVPNSRWSLGTYFAAKYTVYQTVGTGKEFQLYLGPNVTYQLTKNVQANCVYELNAKHMHGSPAGTWDMVNDGTDLQPGINWDITKNYSINPYLNILTGGRIGWDTTGLGFYASGKFN